MVVCGAPEYADDQRDTLLNPLLLIEVLSPSTESLDRGFKAVQYRSMPSVLEYALVAQAEPRVEVLRRQASGDWLLSESAGQGSVCRFDSIQTAVPLREIYEKVAFGGA